MYDILSTLLFVALILLVWLLVAPKSLSKHSKKEITRRKTAPFFAVIILVLLILVAATGPTPYTKNHSVQLTNSKSSHATSGTTIKTPDITESTVFQTQSIPFTTTTVQDSSLSKGTTKITTAGVNGTETLTYQDTYTSGKLTSQKLTGTIVSAQPVTQITSIGTYITPNCWTAAQAANEISQTGCVQFVGYSYTSYKGEMYLDQYLSAPYGFSAWIPAGYTFGGTVLNEYSGQNIDVSGTIINYGGEPEIEVTSASQITLAQ